MTSLVVPAWAWALLAVLMCLLIAIDLFAHRGDRVDSRRRALLWSAGWIVAALGFGGFVWAYFGAAAAEQYLGAYLLEKSLSVDNLFLFLVIFAALGIPRTEQRRVLTWGIIGALVTRGVFIAAGVAVLHRWHEVTYVFGAILLVTALKMLWPSEGGSSRGRGVGAGGWGGGAPTGGGRASARAITSSCGKARAGSARRSCSRCSRSRPRTWSSRSTRSRPRSRSPTSRTWSTARTCSRCSACVRCTSCSPARSATSAICGSGCRPCSRSPARRCW